LDLDEITTSQLAIDGKIEQSQITNLQGHLKPDANCPDFLQLEWWFLACQLALVPGASGFYMIQKVHFDSFAGWSESNYDFKLLQDLTASGRDVPTADTYGVGTRGGYRPATDAWASTIHSE
jgi:hypothetical protein